MNKKAAWNANYATLWGKSNEHLSVSMKEKKKKREKLQNVHIFWFQINNCGINRI